MESCFLKCNKSLSLHTNKSCYLFPKSPLPQMLQTLLFLSSFRYLPVSIRSLCLPVLYLQKYLAEIFGKSVKYDSNLSSILKSLYTSHCVSFPQTTAVYIGQLKSCRLLSLAILPCKLRTRFDNHAKCYLVHIRLELTL